MFLVFDSLRRRFLWLLGRLVSHFTLTRQTILRFVISYRLYARNLTPQASLLDRGEMQRSTLFWAEATHQHSQIVRTMTCGAGIDWFEWSRNRMLFLELLNE